MEKRIEGTNEQQIVPVLKVNGIKDIYYEKTDDFEKSIHSLAYEKACDTTIDIIETARQTESTGETRRNIDLGTDMRNKGQICNIIFFTGEKGSGKTSTMLSYMEFLKDYHRNIKKGNKFVDLLYDKLEQFMFTGIDYIDASTLDEQEDILGNVLSRMLSKWKAEEQRGRYLDSGIIKGNDYEYRKRQMYLQCEEVHERLKELRETKRVLDSDMFIESIESLSFSGNVKNAFQKFVESYLDVMVYPDSKGEITLKNHYLVISIDDIDMNVKSGFMLMEQIRKYLMVPNVLVLMSANYEQLDKICYHHYLKEFEKLERNSENNQYLLKISQEYLEKMIPFQRQVELQANRRWEYFSEKPLQIQYRRSDESMSGLFEEKSTLCKLVARCMYQCFGVKFGWDEKCISYLVPDTVRELCSWVCQVGTLGNCFNGIQCTDIQVFNKNMKWFMSIEYPRLYKKYLDARGRKVIEALAFMGPSGQFRQLKDLFGSGKTEKGKALLELLDNAKESDNKDVQDMAVFALIYFNMLLQQLAVQMQYEKSVDKKKNMARLMLKYYSFEEWGIWGAWERNMLAPMRKQYVIGVRNTEVPVWYRIARSHFKSDNGCLNLELKGKLDAGLLKGLEKNKAQQSIREYIETNKVQIRNYQYLLLFYNLKESDEAPMFWEAFNGEKLVLAKQTGGVFSLSGFVLNLIEESSLLKRFREMLTEVFDGFKVFENKEKRRLQKEIFIDAEDFIFPIQNVDFVIQFGKEVQKRLGNAKREKMDINTIKVQVGRYFETMAECLKEYDQIYAEQFRNYELVKKILQRDEAFESMLAKAIMAHAVQEPQNPGDVGWTEENSNG